MGDQQFIYAEDPQGQRHKAPAGTPLPQGWKAVSGPTARWNDPPDQPKSLKDIVTQAMGDTILPGRGLARTGTDLEKRVDMFRDQVLRPAEAEGGVKGAIANSAGEGLAATARTVGSAGRIVGGITGDPVNAGLAVANVAFPESRLVTGANVAFGAASATGFGGRKKGEKIEDTYERNLLAGAGVVGGATGVKGGMEARTNARAAAANTDHLAAMEEFRTTNKAKPSAKAADQAERAHGHLDPLVDKMWEPVHEALDNHPVDPDHVEAAIGRVRDNPKISKWLDQFIKPVGDEGAKTAPTWAIVKKLNERLFKMQLKSDPVDSANIEDARAKIQELLSQTAFERGMGEAYEKAQAATRDLENIKYKAAYEAKPKSPSKLYTGAGMVLGAPIGHPVVGAIVGHEIGKAMSPKGEYIIPPDTFEAARQLKVRLSIEAGVKPTVKADTPKGSVDPLTEKFKSIVNPDKIAKDTAAMKRALEKSGGKLKPGVAADAAKDVTDPKPED